MYVEGVCIKRQKIRVIPCCTGRVSTSPAKNLPLGEENIAMASELDLASLAVRIHRASAQFDLNCTLCRSLHSSRPIFRCRRCDVA